MASGGTDMSCGVRYALDKGLRVDGIVYISDGANHSSAVKPVYERYCERMGVEPTIYFYKLDGEADVFSREALEIQTFDLRGQRADYYSLPNLVQTMRVARYALLEEILATPLRTLDEVLDKTEGMNV